jgi:hypothetical protein
MPPGFFTFNFNFNFAILPFEAETARLSSRARNARGHVSLPELFLALLSSAKYPENSRGA